jgi:hypothetical protein
MQDDTIPTAIATLRSYARHCHDETATAGGVLVKAYEELVRGLAAMRAEGAEQLAALELALPILEKHEPCGYYCDEDHGHIDHPATYAVYRAVNQHPLGAALVEELAGLRQSNASLHETVEEMTNALLDAERELAAMRAAIKAVSDSAARELNYRDDVVLVSTAALNALRSVGG